MKITCTLWLFFICVYAQNYDVEIVVGPVVDTRGEYRQDYHNMRSIQQEDFNCFVSEIEVCWFENLLCLVNLYYDQCEPLST